MKPREKNGADGFTLVELLVALFIFALIASISMSFLYQTLDSKTVLEGRTAKLQELKLARQLIKMDLVSLVRRPTRGTYGDAPTLSFSGGQRGRGEPFLSLVRAGSGNPGSFQPKSNLQHVQYLLSGENLVRRVRLRLDPASATPVDDFIIMTGIERLEVQFLVGGLWQNRLGLGPAGASEFPTAISLNIESDTFGSLNQYFLIANGAQS